MAETHPRFSGNHRVELILILMWALAVWGLSLFNGFAYDDFVTVADKAWLADLRHIPQIFSLDYFRLSGEGSFRPVVTLSYFLDTFVFHGQAWGYHASNLAYHLVGVILVYRFSLIIFPGTLVAPLATLVFAIHPINAEVVNVISFREDLLVLVFVLGGLLSYRKWMAVRAPGPTGPPMARLLSWYALSLGLFALALFSKEHALSWPLLVVATEWSQRETDSKKVFLRWEYMGIGVVTALYLLIRFGIMTHPTRGAIVETVFHGPKEYLYTMATVVLRYAKLWVFPLNLLIIYPERVYSTLTVPVVVALGLLAGLLWGMGWGARRSRIIRWGLLWVLATGLPVSNLVFTGHLAADRFLYLPSVGLAWMTAALLLAGSELIRQRSWKVVEASRIGLISVLLILLALSSLSIRRTQLWGHEERLWQEAISYDPENYKAHSGLGFAYDRKGWNKEAIEAFKRSIALNPNHSPAYIGLGVRYALLGRNDEAIEAFERGIAVNSSSKFIDESNLWPFYYSLGMLYLKKGEQPARERDREMYREKAIKWFEATIARKHDHAQAMVNLAVLYQEQHQLPAAERVLASLTRVRPKDPKAFQWLAQVAVENNSWGTAQRALEHLVELDPTQSEAWKALVQLYAQQGQSQKALASAQRASAALPTNSDLHFLRGLLLATKGDTPSAIRAFQWALDISPTLASAHRNLGVLYLKNPPNTSAARHHFRKFLQLAPDHPEAENVRQLLQKMGSRR